MVLHALKSLIFFEVRNLCFLFRLHNSWHVWLKLSCWLLQAQEFFFPLGVKITSQSLSCLLDDVAPAAAVYRVFFLPLSLCLQLWKFLHQRFPGMWVVLGVGLCILWEILISTLLIYYDSILLQITKMLRIQSSSSHT
jgi:hypothetical protein